MLLLIGFLRSRRFRDITIVLFPLIGMAYYIGQRLLFQQMERGQVTLRSLLNAPAWRVTGLAAAWLRGGGPGRGRTGDTMARPSLPSSPWRPRALAQYGSR